MLADQGLVSDSALMLADVRNSALMGLVSSMVLAALVLPDQGLVKNVVGSHFAPDSSRCPVVPLDRDGRARVLRPRFPKQ